MNLLQQKEYELLKEFVKICEKLDLQYYLVCGSALGAVKYQGFIPWDDDIDVALPRTDYEIFCEKSQELLPNWIFVQNYRTDKEYPLLITKLRDSRTTFVEKGHRKINMHHGIYIDVFALDGYPQNEEEAIQFELKKGYYERRRIAKLDYNRFKYARCKRTWIVYILYKIFGYCKKTNILLEKYDNFLKSYSLENSDLWCNHANWQGKLEYAPKEQYGKGKVVKFEDIYVRIPEKYDEYLTQKYGNWRLDPPKNEQKPQHNCILLDCDKSYTNYIKKITKNRKKIVLKEK